MTHHCACLIVVAIATVSFSTPITAQQETVDEFQALEWFTGRPGVLAMKIEKSRSEEMAATDMIGGGNLIVSSVALELQSVGFIGVASATRINAHASPPVVTRDADVVVPLDVFQRFLETLLQSPVKEGIYRPSVPRTGGSPKTRVELDLETETVTFFTESLADGGIPWGATFGGRTYVIESDIPSKALRILDPYISPDDSFFGRLDRLLEATPLPTLETLVETLGGSLRQNEQGEVEVVYLDGTPITDAGLAHLTGLTALEELRLNLTQVADAGLVHLAGLPVLETLDLSGTQVTDAGLAHLTGLPSLQSLVLHDTEVTAAGLVHFQKMPALRHLALSGYFSSDRLTDADIANLREALPNVRIEDGAPIAPPPPPPQ